MENSDHLTSENSSVGAGDTAAVTDPGLSGISLLRFLWRQLTSMRTALILLLLLGIASVPGSLFPQRGENPIAVTNFLAAHPFWGKILDSMKFFDVFASPWFGAIYILLFISLIGCVLPRTFEHLKNIGKKPPATPRFLNKMEFYRIVESPVAGSSDSGENRNKQENSLDSLELARRWLKKHHFRIRVQEGSLSAEKGYLRESGNLLFHLSLILLLVGIAVGSFYSTNGEAIVNVGDHFINVPTSYDSISYGRFESGDKLTPFALQLTKFVAHYNLINNEPSDYSLNVLAENPIGAPVKPVLIKVNKPLTYGPTKIYLQANGYSPIVTVKNTKGDVVFNGPTVFLPDDANLTSSGAIKLPDVGPGIGFVGTFVPTFAPSTGGPIKSVFPDALDPRLLLGVWEGDMGLNSGQPQSVYRLDTTKMKQIGLATLKIGQSYNFGIGTITFNGYTPWVNLQIVSDPGKVFALFGALLAVAGLIASLFGRQRRIWVRVLPDSRVEIAGLSKNKAYGLEEEITSLTETIEQEVDKQ
jgi:cytochrome c biogenesis protein